MVSTNALFVSSAVDVFYFRLKVETERLAAVVNCQGYLLWAKRDGKQILGKFDLPFSPSEHSDSISKTIRENVLEFLDILFISRRDNEVALASPDHESPSHASEIIVEPGEYMPSTLHRMIVSLY